MATRQYVLEVKVKQDQFTEGATRLVLSETLVFDSEESADFDYEYELEIAKLEHEALRRLHRVLGRVLDDDRGKETDKEKEDA